MYLHDALRMTLRKAGRSLTSSDLAEIVNRLRLYERKDERLVPARQVSARVRKYPGIFTVDKTSSRIMIGLAEWKK